MLLSIQKQCAVHPQHCCLLQNAANCAHKREYGSSIVYTIYVQCMFYTLKIIQPLLQHCSPGAVYKWPTGTIWLYIQVHTLYEELFHYPKSLSLSQFQQNTHTQKIKAKMQKKKNMNKKNFILIIYLHHLLKRTKPSPYLRLIVH